MIDIFTVGQNTQLFTPALEILARAFPATTGRDGKSLDGMGWEGRMGGLVPSLMCLRVEGISRGYMFHLRFCWMGWDGILSQVPCVSWLRGSVIWGGVLSRLTCVSEYGECSFSFTLQDQN